MAVERPTRLPPITITEVSIGFDMAMIYLQEKFEIC
jgi:hypothetical protein